MHLRSTPVTTHTSGRVGAENGVGRHCCTCCAEGVSGRLREVKSFNIVALINQHLAISGLIQANESSAGVL